MEGVGIVEGDWGLCLPKGPGAPTPSPHLNGSDTQATILGVLWPWHPGYGSKDENKCKGGPMRSK